MQRVFFFLVLFRKKNAIIVYKILEDISMSKLQWYFL